MESTDLAEKKTLKSNNLGLLGFAVSIFERIKIYSKKVYDIGSWQIFSHQFLTDFPEPRFQLFQ